MCGGFEFDGVVDKFVGLSIGKLAKGSSLLVEINLASSDHSSYEQLSSISESVVISLVDVPSQVEPSVVVFALVEHLNLLNSVGACCNSLERHVVERRVIAARSLGADAVKHHPVQMQVVSGVGHLFVAQGSEVSLGIDLVGKGFTGDTL